MDFSQETLSLLERIASGIEKIGAKPTEPAKGAGKIVPENRLEEAWLCILRLGAKASIRGVAKEMGIRSHATLIRDTPGVSELLQVFHLGRQHAIADRRVSKSHESEFKHAANEWDD